MCKTKDESVVLTQYHTFIFLPFLGFNPRRTNLKFHNRYNSTPNFYLHSTYVGRQPVCTSQITTYVQWKALSSFHSFNSPAHLDISRRFDVLEQIRDYRIVQFCSERKSQYSRTSKYINLCLVLLQDPKYFVPVQMF